MSASEQGSSQSLTALAKYGFTQLDHAMAGLDRLVQLVGDTARSALVLFRDAADPDMALVHLIHLAENDRLAIKKILKAKVSGLALIKVLGASEALAEFLSRDPSSLQLFQDSEIRLPTRAEMQNRFERELSFADQGFESVGVIAMLRRNYRRELLRIAIFDLNQTSQASGLPIVAKSLSELAAIALDFGLKVARAELSLSKEFGNFTLTEVAATELAIIGMGKGGAGELNYISDVDVIFVAESNDPELTTERMLEIATRLATRTMRAMDGHNSEPALWQVDANLRPEGKSGALVRTLDSHLAYYQRWAENWEFQALIKATALAGSLELGERYRIALEELVWGSSRRENFVESVQRMRERVTENIPSDEIDWELKLGVGGLRDIEFTVQLLQLVHGREDKSVRAPDTLTAIGQLASSGYIGRVEANTFAENYRFLRLLEHRIQLYKLRRTHLVPNDVERQRVLARSINPDWSAEDLIREWTEIKLSVRQLHQKLFYRPLLVAVAKAEGSLSLSDDQATDRLAAIGFVDARGALQHIQALTTGLSRRAQIQKQLLPVLLEWFGRGTEPDSALLAFRRLSENLGESHWYLRMLRDSSGAAERLANALSTSRLVTNLFELIPEGAAWLDDPAMLKPKGIEELNTEADSLAARHPDLVEMARAIRHIRRRETLRMALGAVSGDTKLPELENGLTVLTQWYLSSLLDAVISALRYNEEPVSSLVDFGLVAMGRFGGGELGFGSDADVMAVYAPLGSTSVTIAQKCASLIISEVKRLAVDPQLEFQIDMDLRPEGKNGPVARSIDSYRAYYSRWSDIWENQALLRARFFYGSQKLGNEFAELVNQYRYPEHIEASAITEIRRIKARMESERLPQGADFNRHLKLGRGSLSDIEWTIQLLQLKHGKDIPEIRTPRTLEALEALVEKGIVEAHDARVLKEAWVLCSRIRSASVLWSSRRSDVLPTDRKQLEGIARILEYPRGSATQLEEEYLARTRRARTVFEKIFYS